MSWDEYDAQNSAWVDPPERTEIVTWLRSLATHIESEAPMVEPRPAARKLHVEIGYAPTSALTDTSGRVPPIAIWRGDIDVDGPRVSIDLRGIGLPPDIAIGQITLRPTS